MMPMMFFSSIKGLIRHNGKKEMQFKKTRIKNIKKKNERIDCLNEDIITYQKQQNKMFKK